jgi:glycosyltransferase involved in cell wall biosynthesis
MNILHVIPFFTPRRGGSVTVAYNLCKELSRLGHHITIITTDYEFDKGYAESLKGIDVIPFKCSFRIGLFLFSPAMKKWLKKNMASFDIAHLHNFRSYQNNIAYVYALKYNIPIVLQAHGSIPRIVEKKGLKWVYDLAWGKRIIRDSSKLVAVSGLEADQYKRFGGDDDKVIIIPNGIDSQSLKIMSPKRGDFRKRISIDQDKKMLLFVGRIHIIKGLGFLLKGFKELLKDRDDVILVIAGPDDGYKASLQGFILDPVLENHVMIIEYLDDVSQAYYDADLLVYPSEYEIFGLVPFEALLCGTPVLATEESGCGELLRKIGCGLLVKYGDTSDLAQKMGYSLDNREQMECMVERGRIYIEDSLEWNVIAKRFYELYEDCLHNP